jgi:hypothetical protein
LATQLLKIFIFGHRPVLVVVLLTWTPHCGEAHLSSLLSPLPLFSPIPLLSPYAGRHPHSAPLQLVRPPWHAAELQLTFLTSLARGRARAHLDFSAYLPGLKADASCAAPRGGGRYRCRLDAHGDRAAGLLCFPASITDGKRCCRREVLPMR